MCFKSSSVPTRTTISKYLCLPVLGVSKILLQSDLQSHVAVLMSIHLLSTLASLKTPKSPKWCHQPCLWGWCRGGLSPWARDIGKPFRCKRAMRHPGGRKSQFLYSNFLSLASYYKEKNEIEADCFECNLLKINYFLVYKIIYVIFLSLWVELVLWYKIIE